METFIKDLLLWVFGVGLALVLFYVHTKAEEENDKSLKALVLIVFGALVILALFFSGD